MDKVTAAKEMFIKIYNEHIKRDGAKELLAYLESEHSDFFTTPASTVFHLAEPGGLVMHSINVYYRLKELVENERSGLFKDIKPETIAIIGLLHDLCKMNNYTVGSRNVKDENGVWKSVPFYKTDEELPYGHGEKSVYIISGFMRLTREEAMAINWHMGGFDARVKGGSYQLGKAYLLHPLSVLTHVADLMATYIDERDTVPTN